MRFPGQRIAKHYFPVSSPTPRNPPVEAPPSQDSAPGKRWYILGLDQIIVDLEVHAPESFTHDLGLVRGESMQLTDTRYRQLIADLDAQGVTYRYAAGGTVSNTLNNYVLLADEPSMLLGSLPKSITPGDAAFHYVAQTHRLVDLEHLQAYEGMVGTAVTFVFPDGERSFAVAAGVSNDFPDTAIPEGAVEDATIALASLYTLIDPAWPIAQATHRLFERAKAADIPVAFGLGTAGLVARM
ncbi:MAG: hypothetical protein KAI47_05250, partial [Deltaproteobacteria bacterium]|nr:hypothetical protein [Deltaproteobacteria bacterium]